MLLNLVLLLFFLILLIVAISKWKIHPFIALIFIALAMGVSMGMGGEKTVEVLLKGFSETLRWIAIIIILGAFIGEVLQETGGAFRISNKIVKWSGAKRLPWAMGFTGYIVSIPVFIDVAYILLQPVIESLSARSNKPVLFIGLSLAAGLTVSHTLIPPTPGPMAVASLLGVDIGRMLMINLLVAIFAMIGGVLWVIYRCKNMWIAYDEKLKNRFPKTDEKDVVIEILSGRSLFYDVLPILAPIVLIAMGSFVQVDGSTVFGSILNFITLPLVAVVIGAIIAAFQIHSNDRRGVLNRLVEQAIIKSSLVIMITGAGGALGYVIRETGVQDGILQMFAEFPFLGILLPFFVASMLTISTGSITVALVGSASMLGPIAHSLPISPEIMAASIGCGSFCVFHANSSFFWLLNRLHEVPPKILYKSFTLQSLVMGLSGLLAVLLLKFIGL